MSAVFAFPTPQAAINRIAERQRREDIRQACLDILYHHGWHSENDVTDAWVNLALVGTDDEKAIALKQIEARETSARIALRHLPRWPALLAGSVAFLAIAWGVVALVMGVGG